MGWKMLEQNPSIFLKMLVPFQNQGPRVGVRNYGADHFPGELELEPKPKWSRNPEKIICLSRNEFRAPTLQLPLFILPLTSLTPFHLSSPLLTCPTSFHHSRFLPRNLLHTTPSFSLLLKIIRTGAKTSFLVEPKPSRIFVELEPRPGKFTEANVKNFSRS